MSKSKRAPDGDDAPPPSRPPLRNTTPSVVGECEESSSMAESSTLASADIPSPPVLRSHEQLPSLFPRYNNTITHIQLTDGLPQGSSSLAITASTAKEADTTTMTDEGFYVKSYMASLGTQENTNVIMRVKPGAVSVHGIRLPSVEEDSFDNVQHEDVEDPLPLAAELSPHEGGAIHELTETLKRQITETIQEQMEAQQQQQQQLAYTHSSDYPPPVLAEAIVAAPFPARADALDPNKPLPLRNDNFKVCGLRRRTWGFVLLVFFALAAGGVVGALLYLQRTNNNEDSSSSSSSSSPPLSDNTTDPRVDELRDELFPFIAPTDRDLDRFSNPSSPQSMAWNWIGNDEISLSTTRPTERVVERYALAVLYFSTNGPQWRRPADTADDFGYLSSAEVCAWNNRLDPVDDTDAVGIFCALDSRVNFVRLKNNGLQGVIPWELSLLSEMEVIELDNNSLRGTIPFQIANLSNLHSFWAFSNFFTGSLPTSLGPNMESIDLASNEFSGTLPYAWGNTMPRLFWIGLAFNQLTGTLPSGWTSLTDMTQLNLESNLLTGTIPSYGVYWRHMTSLFLEKNKLTGRLPASVAQMTALQNLVVYDNALTGSIPSALGGLTALQRLSLAANDFKGSLDETLCLTLPESTLLVADCLPDDSTGEIQVQCVCCSTCCSRESGECELYDSA